MNRWIKLFTVNRKDVKTIEINFNIEPIIFSIIIFGAVSKWLEV